MTLSAPFTRTDKLPRAANRKQMNYCMTLDAKPTIEFFSDVSPNSVGACATLACLWEATAPKPGNVTRAADFNNMSYADFLTSAAVIGPCFERATTEGVGATVLAAVQATRAAVGKNTNLGTVLLLAPLATVPVSQPLVSSVNLVLDQLTAIDTREVYNAIRLAQPAGLGHVDRADVHDISPPEIPLVEAMQLAAERDTVAKQYTIGFKQVFTTADRIELATHSGLPLSDAIIHAFLQLLAEQPDSLIARKCGAPQATEISTRVAAIINQAKSGSNQYQKAVAELDFYLRSDGHRRNPGTTADLIAAALFVLLREQRLDWPIRFYARR